MIRSEVSNIKGPVSYRIYVDSNGSVNDPDRLRRRDHVTTVSRSSANSTGLDLAHLRRFAIRRSLFTATTLEDAIATFGFVQADPIRAPARAQDLTLRHRVENYHAGDLERRYSRLLVHEDFFINYG